MGDFNLIDATTGEIIDSDMQFSGIELESDFRIIMDMIIDKAGLDIKIDDIFNMTEEEKKKLIRNLKISDIIDGE